MRRERAIGARLSSSLAGLVCMSLDSVCEPSQRCV